MTVTIQEDEKNKHNFYYFLGWEQEGEMGRGEIQHKCPDTKWSSDKEAISFRPDTSTPGTRETAANELCVYIGQGIMTKYLSHTVNFF